MNIKLSVYGPIYFDIDEVWKEIDNETLRSEVKKRKLQFDEPPFLEDKEAIRQIIIERMEWSEHASDANIIFELRKMFSPKEKKSAFRERLEEVQRLKNELDH